MITTADQIRANLRAVGDIDWLPEPEPERAAVRQLRDEPPARAAERPPLIDIDMGVGRLMAGWDNIHRHAKVWTGEAPPEAPRLNPLRQGCPSEAAYRRHLQDGEKCAACRAVVRELERKRKQRVSLGRRRSGGGRS